MELFLETYQQYECLWNNKCKDYSKVKLREKAYSSMLGDLNLPGLTVTDCEPLADTTVACQKLMPNWMKIIICIGG